MKIEFVLKKRDSLKILCLGAHGDDIEIGCGGAILKLASEYRNAEVKWVVFSSKGQRKDEVLASAHGFLRDVKRKQVVVENYKDGYFPYRGEVQKLFFEKLMKSYSPDLIFSHYRYDLHQDHRLISELTWNTFRDNLILEYEILKYDGDLGAPNLFIHLDAAICQRKVTLILESFKTQKTKEWFTADAFFSIMRIRGIESRAPEKFAEGFYCRKLVL
jgi:LmbE family N-acetylglucosaminyl deacetylase